MIESGETSVILYHHHDHRAGRRLTGVAGALSEPHRQTGQASAGRAWRRRRSGACRFGVDHDRSSGARGDAEGDRCRCSSGAVGLDREVRMIPSNSAWKAVPLPPGPCSRASCDTQPRSSPQTGRVVDRLGTGVKRWSDLATPRRKARPPFRLAALAHGPPFQRRPAGRWSIFDRNSRTTPARGRSGPQAHGVEATCFRPERNSASAATSMNGERTRHTIPACVALSPITLKP